MTAENIVHFARVLRSARVPIGPDRVLAAMAAIEQVGRNRRDDVHSALDAFWRDPKLLEQLMLLLPSKISGRGDKAVAPRANRLAEAPAAPTRPKEPPNPANNSADEELEFDTSFTFSERERLQQADFESMTTSRARARSREKAR
jgi:uncharacterized protein with von Willebrand factor type A (vWA) domain